MTRVIRLPRDPGPAAWNELLLPAPPPRVLEADRTADWLVIGAGFAGLAAARRLTQLRGGDRIALVEAHRIGSGPAGRNSGFMIDLPHKLTSDNYAGVAEVDTTQTELNRAAIKFAAGAAEEYGLGPEAFCRSGKVNGAATKRGLAANAAYARHLASLGEPYELLDAAAMQELTGSEYYLGGVFTPGAAMIQPAMFVRGLAEGIAGRVAIFESSPVIGLHRQGADWRVESPRGSITAPRVILAVNGHVESFGYFRRRLVHIHLYASMTRALTAEQARRLGGARNWGITPADPIGSTVRRISGTSGDRIVIRNRVTYDPDMESDEVRLAAMGESHDRSVNQRFPQLNGIDMEYRWGGRLCLSLNDVPAFGEIDDGLFAACCQNGLGTTKGTVSGMLAADLAAQGNSPLAAKMAAFDAPRRLPPEPIAWLGANAALKWKEWRARREI
ncbi:FAD-binding oxidoreductase [Pelagibius litoralis]|uniref:FAD-binding oxidoreductase n=1 Tax=Pelagibius litoralis TaxID=374515 RepID=A0A967EZR1_9PROT|nr:FAD-binding oxidoreductase [Pelagibius litoralis]NIA70374.1 FAD-binding oxidoreductase [Pelagibius litoralis]